jgi:hypothetical protein
VGEFIKINLKETTREGLELSKAMLTVEKLMLRSTLSDKRGSKKKLLPQCCTYGFEGMG